MPKSSFFILAVLTVCFVCGAFIEDLLAGEERFQSLWPPSAVIMTALLLSSKSHWLPILFITVALQWLMQISATAPELLWSVSNIVVVTLVASVIRIQFPLPPKASFIQSRNFLMFLATGVAPFAASYIEVLLLSVVQNSDFNAALLLQRLLTNGCTLLVAISIILLNDNVFGTDGRVSGEARRDYKWPVAVALLAALSLLAFVNLTGARKDFVLVLLPLLPLAFWISGRFDVGFVSFLSLIGAVTGAYLLLESTVASGAADDLSIHVFQIFAISPLLVIAELHRDWRAALYSQKNMARQWEMVSESTGCDCWRWDLGADQFRWVSRQGRMPEPRLDEEAALSSKHWPSLTEFSMHLHIDDRNRFIDSVYATLHDGIPRDIEFRYRENESELYSWFRCLLQSQPDFAQKNHYVFGVNINLSQNQREYLQLEQQRNELAHLSRVAMMGETSGAIAHELNQPLTAILSNAQAARRILKKILPETDTFSEILDDIVFETRRASEIIVRMRSFLKRGEMQLVTTDVNDVIPDIIDFKRCHLVGKNIVIVTDLQKQMPPVKVDVIQLQQILLNIVSNACDAMQNSTTSCRLIRITTRSSDHDWVEILVTDHGVGIAESDLERIFDPFYTTKKEGLGLGLSICRSIANGHGGKLWASNNPMGGATVHLRLPSCPDS